MPRDHTGALPGFRIHTESWWASSNPVDYKGTGAYEEIMVGFYDSHMGEIGAGRASGEFGFIWYKLNNKPAIRLECYSDGWSSLIRIPRLLNMLNDMDSDARYNAGDVSPAKFADMLKSIGIIDMTSREQS